jgi:hypothetical protein
MGDLIKNFTFDRNTLKRTALASAQAAANHVLKVQNGETLDKTASNIVGALAHYMGLFIRKNDSYIPSKLAAEYMDMFAKNSEDAFQWLLARSLWRFYIPNGTACSANAIARRLGLKFNFFHTLLAWLTHLQGMQGLERFLSYEELCAILNDDGNWALSPTKLFSLTIERRLKAGPGSYKRKFLEDLEVEYKIGRDNFSGLFNKALAQTGLFDYVESSGSEVGIAISPHLAPHHQRRIRYMLDNPTKPDSDDPNYWEQFMEIQKDDLPRETIFVAPQTPTSVIPDEQLDLTSLSYAAYQAITSCGIRLQRSLLDRMLSSLLAKRFMIVTGMSGSGKTRICQALAAWLCPDSPLAVSPFHPGTKITSDRISYYVNTEDSLSVELWNDSDPGKATRVILSKEMISEWARCIVEHSFTRDTSAREIRETVKSGSMFSDQLHSFETHLKAAAFHQIEFIGHLEMNRRWRVIPVGSDWTNREPIFGYPDALTSGIYRLPSSGALQLIISAQNDPNHPYFLILDEMNLSHVERYFADVLSGMESDQSINLHEMDSQKDVNGVEVPKEIYLSPNLFVIGTVNVDETTYMFSPKVLDRANVIECMVNYEEISGFLQNPVPLDMSGIVGQGAAYSTLFVAEARRKNITWDGVKSNVDDSARKSANKTLEELFKQLESVGAEFGYRPAYEISRFMYYHALITGNAWSADIGLDAAIMQKLLPKLHGSKTKLGPLFTELKKILTDKRFPISYAKIERMERRLKQNGFTSYAEA